MTALAKVEKIFEGQAISAYLWEGKPAWIAKELGRAMGYSEDGKGLVDTIRQKWGADLIEGTDYEILEGERLELFKNHQASNSRLVEPRAAHLLLLKESGFHAVCLKTDKPVGVRLRRWLVDEVMPSLVRTGSYQAPPSRGEALQYSAMEGLQRAAARGEQWAVKLAFEIAQKEARRALPVENEEEKRAAVLEKLAKGARRSGVGGYPAWSLIQEQRVYCREQGLKPFPMKQFVGWLYQNGWEERWDGKYRGRVKIMCPPESQMTDRSLLALRTAVGPGILGRTIQGESHEHRDGASQRDGDKGERAVQE